MLQLACCKYLLQQHTTPKKSGFGIARLKSQLLSKSHQGWVWNITPHHFAFS